SAFTSGSMKAIWNNMRAVDLLQSLPEVDGERIGCIGHSLGGHNTMFTGVFDTRIKAMVSNCGFTSFPKYFGGKLKGWTSARYMPRIATVYELKPEKVPFDFPEVVAALAGSGVGGLCCKSAALEGGGVVSPLSRGGRGVGGEGSVQKA